MRIGRAARWDTGRLSLLSAPVLVGLAVFATTAAAMANSGNTLPANSPLRSAEARAQANRQAMELALSRLVEQYGVTTHAAADIDALAAQRLESQRWIVPADREAIAAAAAEVAEISNRQAAAIDRIKGQLAR